MSESRNTEGNDRQEDQKEEQATPAEINPFLECLPAAWSPEAAALGKAVAEAAFHLKKVRDEEKSKQGKSEIAALREKKVEHLENYKSQCAGIAQKIEMAAVIVPFDGAHVAELIREGLNLMKIAKERVGQLKHEAHEVGRYTKQVGSALVKYKKAMDNLEQQLEKEALEQKATLPPVGGAEELKEGEEAADLALAELPWAADNQIPSKLCTATWDTDPEPLQEPLGLILAPGATSSHPSDITWDVCSTCGLVIQFDAQFGKGVPRYHCMDCLNGDGVMCAPCHQIAEASLGAIALLEERRWLISVEIAETVLLLHDLCPHIEHHLCGPEDDIMYFMHADAKDNLNVAFTIEKCLGLFAHRPYFGVVYDGEDPKALESLHSTPPSYRTWMDRKLLLPAALPKEHTAVDETVENALAAHLPKLLRVVWATFAEVGRCMMIVAEMASRLAKLPGERIGVSVNDSGLWYTVEIGVVAGKRCACGAYPLWEPRDILDAFQLADVKAAFVDVTVFSAMIAAVSEKRAEWPRSLGVIVLLQWKSNTGVAAAQELIRGAKEGNLPFRAILLELDLFSKKAAFDVSDNRKAAAEIVDEIFPLLLDTGESTDEIPDDSTLDATIIFTSGTSGGKPKGVRLSAHDFYQEGERAWSPIHFCSVSAYAPAWATDKRAAFGAIFSGGRCAFHYKPRHVFETFRAVGPTPTMSIVPFLASQLPGQFSLAAERELKRLEEEEKEATSLWSKMARSQAAACHFIYDKLLGGRMYLISCGGAAVRQDILAFLRDVTPCSISESFGLTECGGVLRNNEPFPDAEVKLVDRPDLGYCTTDKPFPRGEFAVRSKETTRLDNWICDGDTLEKVKQRYLPDGWMLTGDIGLQRSDGKYEVIDRASAVQKLANGKFFSPERVEQVFMDHVAAVLEMSAGSERKLLNCVSNCVIFVEEDNATLTALVLCRIEDGSSLFDESTKSFVSGCTFMDNAQQILLRHMHQACAESGVPSDEIPNFVFIDLEIDGCGSCTGWTQDNGCLTTSRKPNRRRLKERLQMVREHNYNNNSSKLTSGSTDAACGLIDKEKEDGVLLSPKHLAAALVQSIVPKCVPQNASLSTPEQFPLNTQFAALGCDSLTLAKVPFMMNTLLRKFRGMLPSSLSPMSIRLQSDLPASTLSAPSLLGMTPLELSLKIWDKEAEDVAPYNCADAQPVYMTRQVSTVMAVSDEQHEAETKARPTTVQRDDDDKDEEDEIERERMGMGEPVGSEIVRSKSEIVSKERSNDAMNDELGEAVLPAALTSEDTDWKGYFVQLDNALDALVRKVENNLVDRIAAARKEQQQQPQELELQEQQKEKDGKRKYRVFLTGAAGYLGSSILVDLLNNEQVEQVVCLVRAKTHTSDTNLDVEATKRVEAIMARYGDTSLMEKIKDKAAIIHGDLCVDSFGLPPERYVSMMLSPRPFDVIIHNASVIKSWDLVHGFEQLLAPNVFGTLRVAGMAADSAPYRASKSPVPILYISTSSVVKSAKIVNSDGDSCSWAGLGELDDEEWKRFDAYSGTKLFAENLLRNFAVKCASSLTIVRPPLVTWPHREEVATANEDDWINRFINTCLDVNMFPVSELQKTAIHFAPLDKCSCEIVRLGVKLAEHSYDEPEETFFSVSYPYHTRDDRLSVAGVMETLQQVCQEEGFKMLQTPYYAWLKGMVAITEMHSTPYAPLLERGVVGTARQASGVIFNPSHTGSEEAKEMWRGPLRRFVKRQITKLNNVE